MIMKYNQEEYNKLLSLEDKIELNKSRLENLPSMPLTEGYDILNTPEYQDALNFFQEELEAAEEDLEFWDDDKYLRDFFSER